MKSNSTRQCDVETFGRLSRRALYAAQTAHWAPVAHVVDSWTYRDTDGTRQRQIKVLCPLCGKTHVHGGTLGKRGFDGHKISHCTTAGLTAFPPGMSRGYYIFDDTELSDYEKRAARG